MAVPRAGETPEIRGARPEAGGGRRQFLLLMGMLLALAWLTLLLWEQSPYGRYLDHGRWTEIGLGGLVCRVLPGGSVVLPALLYVGGWVLMTAAMMLPTTIPLLEIVRRLTRTRRDTGRLVALVMGGYLAVWSLFGLAAHLLDQGVNLAVQQNVWLGLNGWVLGSIVLGVAGAFQFTDLKYRCLDQCRAPLSFVLRHWRGGNVQRQAVAIGAHHGLFCVGCCWVRSWRLKKTSPSVATSANRWVERSSRAQRLSHFRMMPFPIFQAHFLKTASAVGNSRTESTESFGEHRERATSSLAGA